MNKNKKIKINKIKNKKTHIQIMGRMIFFEMIWMN